MDFLCRIYSNFDTKQGFLFGPSVNLDPLCKREFLSLFASLSRETGPRSVTSFCSCSCGSSEHLLPGAVDSGLRLLSLSGFFLT